MYKVNDKDKTNLLSTNSESTTLGVWHWTHGKLSGLNWSRGSYKVVGYVKYDESIFNYAKENRLSNQMLYFLMLSVKLYKTTLIEFQKKTTVIIKNMFTALQSQKPICPAKRK